MTKTENLQLNKPDAEDYYDIAVQNTNLDILDTEAKNVKTHIDNVNNPHKVTKAQIGLSNVNNTSDMSKPVSTAQQTAISAVQTNLDTHTANTGNPHKVTASQVGLGNVPNVSTNNQKPTYTEASSLTALASGETLSTGFGKIAKAVSSLISHLSNKSNPHGVTATQVGLGNVPNVTTNNQTPTYSDATTLATLTSGESMSTAFGKIKLAITNLINHIANVSNPHNVTKAQIGLGNVNNTSDANKPVSTATQTAISTVQTSLDTHTANVSNPHSVTKSQVGLGSVPNVSTNDQTPTYTVASANTALTSGEKLSVAMGKIAKAINSLISHLADTSVHITPTTNGGKLSKPLEITATSGSNGLAVSYQLNSTNSIQSVIGGQTCSFVGGKFEMNPNDFKCKGNLFSNYAYVGDDISGYSEVMTAKGGTFTGNITVDDTEYGFKSILGGGEVNLCGSTLTIGIGSVVFGGGVKNTSESTGGTLLHTGNCAPVIISATSPSNTGAVWWDTGTNKLKRYSNGSWIALSY